jgi:hypothetical protein
VKGQVEAHPGRDFPGLPGSAHPGAGIAAFTVQFLRYLKVPQVVLMAGLGLLVVGALKLFPGLAAKLDSAWSKGSAKKLF